MRHIRTRARAGCAQLLGEEDAQATVEMVVVAPVMIVLALIIYNLMLFTAAVARFDRIAPEIVIARGVSPAGNVGTAGVLRAITEGIEQGMDGYAVEVDVAIEHDGDEDTDALLSLAGQPRTYICRMRYVPWPSGLTVAGVDMGAPAFLSHERPVVVDPWRPGVVL